MDKIPALIDSQKSSHNNPSKQSELILKIALLKTEHEAYESTDSLHTANNIVIGEQDSDS